MPEANKFTNAEYLHEHGFFIGNNHMINESDFAMLNYLVEEFCK